MKLERDRHALRLPRRTSSSSTMCRAYPLLPTGHCPPSGVWCYPRRLVSTRNLRPRLRSFEGARTYKTGAVRPRTFGLGDLAVRTGRSPIHDRRWYTNRNRSPAHGSRDRGRHRGAASSGTARSSALRSATASRCPTVGSSTSSWSWGRRCSSSPTSSPNTTRWRQLLPRSCCTCTSTTSTRCGLVRSQRVRKSHDLCRTWCGASTRAS